jgi:predicted nucleic acid-binding protein
LIYLDACLLIYVTENVRPWAASIAATMRAHAGQGFAISPLVAMECLVAPLRNSNVPLEAEFRRAFADFTMLEIGEPVFLEAAAFRAHHALKTPDALHLACAQHHGCVALWTADHRFRTAGQGYVRVLTP